MSLHDSVVIEGEVNLLNVIDGDPAVVLANTPIPDGSITEAKLSDSLKLKTINEYVTPEMYGAKGDGITDDTQAIQNAIDNGSHVIFSNHYVVSCPSNSVSALHLNTGSHIEFKNNATIELAPNAFTAGMIFEATNVNNIKFSGMGEIIGDKLTHTGTTGEYGHGIALNKCSNVNISGITVKQCWGDGIYIGSGNVAPCGNVFIHDCNISNNSRNNISVISVDKCLISNVVVNGADRKSPQAGIGIEPNDNAIDYVRNCRIENIIALNNGGASIQVAFYGSTNSSHVIIDGVSADIKAILISRVGSHLIELYGYTFKADPALTNANYRSGLSVESNETSRIIAEGTIYTDVNSGDHKTIVSCGTNLYNFNGRFNVLGNSSLVSPLFYGLPTNWGGNSLIVKLNCAYAPVYTVDHGGKWYFDTFDVEFMNVFNVTVNASTPNLFGGRYNVPSDSASAGFNANHNAKVLPQSKYVIKNNKASTFTAFGITLPAHSYNEIMCYSFGLFGLVKQFTWTE